MIVIIVGFFIIRELRRLSFDSFSCETRLLLNDLTRDTGGKLSLLASVAQRCLGTSAFKSA